MADDRDHALFHALVRRREALGAIGLAGAGAVLFGRPGGLALGTPEAAAAGACSLDPEVTEGPHHIDNDLYYRAAGGSAALVSLPRRSSTSLSKGYNGSAVLAVKP